MASCPKCLSNIEISSQFFGGLFTCPQCQAVYFIGFDGVPEGNIGSEPTTEAAAESIEQPIQNYEVPAQEFYQAPIEQPVMELSEPMTPEQSFQDVVQYGNTDMTSSPLTFQVTIEGLDILQNINELKEVFADSKLQMNFQELKSKIKNGKLLIEKIQPAKAAILVQRLRALDLKMHWEQKVYE